MNVTLIAYFKTTTLTSFFLDNIKNSLFLDCKNLYNLFFFTLYNKNKKNLLRNVSFQEKDR